MQNTRKYFAILAIAASLSMLAACSKSDDTSAAGNGAADTTQPAAPESAPTPAPSSETTPAPSSDATPSSSSGDSSMSDKAKGATDSVAEKAGEMKDSAGQAMDDMGHAIKKGAAEANEKIQGTVGNGTATSTPPTPSANSQ